MISFFRSTATIRKEQVDLNRREAQRPGWCKPKAHAAHPSGEINNYHGETLLAETSGWDETQKKKEKTERVTPTCTLDAMLSGTGTRWQCPCPSIDQSIGRLRWGGEMRAEAGKDSGARFLLTLPSRLEERPNRLSAKAKILFHLVCSLSLHPPSREGLSSHPTRATPDELSVCLVHTCTLQITPGSRSGERGRPAAPFETVEYGNKWGSFHKRRPQPQRNRKKAQEEREASQSTSKAPAKDARKTNQAGAGQRELTSTLIKFSFSAKNSSDARMTLAPSAAEESSTYEVVRRCAEGESSGSWR